jgi:hypothetical protein
MLYNKMLPQLLGFFFYIVLVVVVLLVHGWQLT